MDDEARSPTEALERRCAALEAERDEALRELVEAKRARTDAGRDLCERLRNDFTEMGRRIRLDIERRAGELPPAEQVRMMSHAEAYDFVSWLLLNYRRRLEGLPPEPPPGAPREDEGPTVDEARRPDADAAEPPGDPAPAASRWDLLDVD